MDDMDTTQGAQADEPKSQEQIGEDALHVAEDVAEAAVPAAVEGAATGGTAAAVEDAMAAGAAVVEREAPTVLGEEWDAVKVWVRKELHLMQQGHSEETRKTANP